MTDPIITSPWALYPEMFADLARRRPHHKVRHLRERDQALLDAKTKKAPPNPGD